MATMAMVVPAFPGGSLFCCSLTTSTVASAAHHGRCTGAGAVAAARPALRTTCPPLCSSFINSVDLYGPSASVVFGEAACLYVSTSLNPISQAKRSMKVVGLFGLGVPELVVVAGVAVLLFGPKKLPEIGKTLGKTMKSFQQAADEFKTELKDETEFSTSNSEIPPAESISEKENAEKKV
ncbi:hypothetical protein O6H91_16G047600 [Diphasiastrum complanatum]|uniref:Uncharacterized protein n=1 Tax=Diphasiastrum complanatum TaxID=34168 RepID=A0ACC2BC26_DIPCM|nr:hypothetical protein O6H91_16G047600 [Diphasiastrum complanatum]